MPLSKTELTLWRAKAEAGEEIPLEITARFIATIRKNFLAKPVQPSRIKKPPADEQSVDFF